MTETTTSIQVTTYTGQTVEKREDQLATEEPLEISVEYGPHLLRNTSKVSITMRTPGEDEYLAAGFLFTEGILQDKEEIIGYAFPNTLPGMSGNYILVSLAENSNFDRKKLDRNFYTTSSCGVCGKASIDAIKTVSRFDIISAPLVINPAIIYSLPFKLAQAQETFISTGGLHASAIFDMDGNLLLLSEDVGRHNALDKLVGKALDSGILPLSSHILMLSGRASFELLQKASMAGIKLVCAVGAPSSLAVETAREFGITLIGFLRDNRFNVYTS